MDSRELYVFVACLGSVCALENIALGKVTVMSSSENGKEWLADAAVDGNTDQTLKGNSCAVTSPESEAWWQVDLGATSNIEQVKIYYRDEKDGTSYTYKLSGFIIFVSSNNTSLGSSCYVNNNGDQVDPGPKSITSFPCVATGRYVTIYKSRKSFCALKSLFTLGQCVQLELCEVEVLGSQNQDETTAVTTIGSQDQDGTITTDNLKKYNCPNNCLNKICDMDDRCFNCQDGYTGVFCNVMCEPGKYGRNCSQICDSRCKKGNCNHETGQCATACTPGRKGRFCDQRCGYKEYGIDCLRTCNNCLEGGCSAKTGICLKGCISGWTGPSCSSPTGNQLTAVVIVLSVGLAILIAINVLIIIKLGLIRHGNDNSRNQNRNDIGTQAAASYSTSEMYENRNMTYDSVAADVEDTHTYSPLQTKGHRY